jgi:hypothetical protein
MASRIQRLTGWLAVALSTALSCLWAFWGIIENFHEGWYYDSLARNLGLMAAQYLAPLFAFLGLALASVRWPRLGAALHLAVALLALWFFRPSSPTNALLIAGPLGLLGVLYAFGRPEPWRRAAAVAAAPPLLVLLVCGVGPAWRVAGRVDDGDRGARLVEGNGVRLVWAPAGPGWPRGGVSWDEAVRRCRHLSADGARLCDQPQNVWRLPTADEAVRSMARHGRNCGGAWDAASGRAAYRVTPDKESPLWDTRSPVIYWWLATEADEQSAYIIVYDGKAWPRRKSARWGYLGFRAVKDVRADGSAGG